MTRVQDLEGSTAVPKTLKINFIRATTICFFYILFIIFFKLNKQTNRAQMQLLPVVTVILSAAVGGKVVDTGT